MGLEKNYAPQQIEKKWYQYWMENGYFYSKPDHREPFTIVIPPPNVTGVLHMGHMLNNTIQDVLVRKARMEGKNACWVPGTDHASIATEAKVVHYLREKGIKKSHLSREAFLKHAWEWKEKHGGIILNQLKQLGASCDWNRTSFTMDPKLYDSVIQVFIDLYNKGLIYKGLRMINWDPKAKTALSNEEVIHKDEKSKLYYVKYPIVGKKGVFITIATTRPETIIADTAVCINPKDKRYSALQGEKVLIPLADRQVPIICDDYVDIEFGTGALKVTPAHDENDYMLGEKHGLETIEVLDQEGKLKANAGKYKGLDRFEARKTMVEDLDALGLLDKIEEIDNKVGYSERTNVVIEPRLSLQWFCKMDHLAEKALDNVLNGNIKFYPKKIENTYKHWMSNIKDWCISRQLWWGQRIPAFYLKEDKSQFVVAKNQAEALLLMKEKTGKNILASDLQQDEDVLDTWFSSWLWPISVFDGILEPDNKEIKYYYPTNDLVTAPEILFFWVARMIMAGYEYKNQLPFRNVYFTGIVRDKQRRKMSKSLGNSPDPIDLIGEFGADGVRVGMLLSSPAGNDLLFDESLCEQGRNFSNKIWNAFRLITSWEVSNEGEKGEVYDLANIWMTHKLNKALEELEDHYTRFRISDALMVVYKLIWDDFCSWYLELVKPSRGKLMHSETYNKVIVLFEKILKVLHPLSPFISEEIWQSIKERQVKEALIVSAYPKPEEFDPEVLQTFEKIQALITQIRSIKKTHNIKLNQLVPLYLKGQDGDQYLKWQSVVAKLSGLEKLEVVEKEPAQAVSFIVQNTEFFIPVKRSAEDVEREKIKIAGEIEYTRGFLNSVEKKLNNQKFVGSAPAQVVEIERKKQEDALEKIKLLEQQIQQLS